MILQPGHRTRQKLSIGEDGAVERFTQPRLVEVEADEGEILTERQQLCTGQRISGQR